MSTMADAATSILNGTRMSETENYEDARIAMAQVYASLAIAESLDALAAALRAAPPADEPTEETR